jgi:uncharacterized protein (DUF1697 family)
MIGEASGRYLALLRGINHAGPSRRVAMADLRALFEGLGFRHVQTLLNSGDVVFPVPTARRGDVHALIEQAESKRQRVEAGVGRWLE